MGRRGQCLLTAIASIGLLVGGPLPGQAETESGEDRPAAIPLGSWATPLAQTTPSSATPPASRHRIRLRRGPYFPDLSRLTPPFPDPIFPEIVYPMRLVIRLSHRRVYVYRGDEVHTSYPIAVGKPGWETPVGEYTITNMQENPVWRNPFNGSLVPAGANNPLGDRWIGFWTDGNNVIGFHGTPNESSVGQAASHGCVRMLNRDVRELYAIAELGMPVIVEP
ncbi:MAG: L,D-transpeptidase [Leptolyngbyaceae bacterium]|nr:L,D-transpeptidase [Leptolyngbyaceae bacterium]